MPALFALIADEYDPDQKPDWHGTTTVQTRVWTCGYCGRDVASNRGWDMSRVSHARGPVVTGSLVICPQCGYPSFIEGDLQVPSLPYGKEIEHLPEDVAALYEEVRLAMSAGAPTAAVMAGRKILMAVAVDNGAPHDQNFAAYVDYLVEKGVVTPTMRDLVDEIRKVGNEANHEIQLVSPESATEVIECVEMVLEVAYAFPGRGRRAREARDARGT